MDQAWQPSGYTSPNLRVYPWMWLWDSCFHALIWAGLEDERAVAELASVFTWQGDDGFVPHMGYQANPAASVPMWSRSGASTITQPPMFGHAARALAASGYEIDSRMLDQIERGLAYFWRYRMGDDGLIRIVHPWETGADDSPRWDAWAPFPFDKAGFDAAKQTMVGALEVTAAGSSSTSSMFNVASAMFNALVAFNAQEFADLVDDAAWRTRARELAAAIDRHWDGVTWSDAGDHSSAAVPTSDALLPCLVNRHRLTAVEEQLFDPDGLGSAYGPRNVDRRYPGYDSTGYWRGPTWPQINYLLWVALQVRPAAAARLADQTVRGAWTSEFSEYWDPDTGAGHGARPQSWTCLALLMHPEHGS